MKLLFIRHGQTDGNKNGILYGHLDLPMNELGWVQIEKVAQELKGRPIVAIYSSPLLRAKETAGIVNVHFDLPILYDKALEERDFGTLAGHKIVDLPTLYGEDFWEKDKRQEYDYRPFGGESAQQVKKRVLDFIEKLKPHYQENDEVIIITHGGVIRLLNHLFSPETDTSEVEHGKIYEFVF